MWRWWWWMDLGSSERLDPRGLWGRERERELDVRMDRIRVVKQPASLSPPPLPLPTSLSSLTPSRRRRAICSFTSSHGTWDARAGKGSSDTTYLDRSDRHPPPPPPTMATTTTTTSPRPLSKCSKQAWSGGPPPPSVRSRDSVGNRRSSIPSTDARVHCCQTHIPPAAHHDLHSHRNCQHIHAAAAAAAAARSSASPRMTRWLPTLRYLPAAWTAGPANQSSAT
ncbi:hypothetical protein QBC39DRAFT_185962 [Podospora conica]|nr:hypothetical protein QBC39DRAFT_185962 [Schizothecium conicum]